MKFRRIIALAGAILLALMYLSTLIFSLMRGELATDLFKASVYCTLIIPIFLYLYSMVYKYLKQRGEEIREEDRARMDAASQDPSSETEKTTDGAKPKPGK